MREDNGYHIIRIVMTLAKIEIVDGYKYEYDKTYDRYEDTLEGPSVGFSLFAHLEHYWNNVPNRK